MSCYFLGVVSKHDHEEYAKYSQANVGLVSGLDLKVHALTDEVKVLEGEFDATSIVLLEFSDDAEFRKWWDSDEYAKIKPLRHASADTLFAVTFGEDE